MKCSIVLFTTVFLLLKLSTIAQSSSKNDNDENKFAFITLPMGISIPLQDSKEDALKAAMFYFANRDEEVINCIHLASCKITKTENLGTEEDQAPMKLPNGQLSKSVMVKAKIKLCAVTWDAEFVVDKDISLKHLYLNELNGVLDWSLLGYFENNLSSTFRNWILTGRYNDRNAPMLKAGQKFTLKGIHSRMCGLASDNKWTCLFLRDETKKGEPTVSIQLTKATTLDAKSVSVDYELKDGDAKTLHFDVYRSKTDHLDNLLSIEENNDLKKLGDTTIGQEIGATNGQDASLTLGKHTSLTFIKGTELKPDTRMPYIIVVATCDGAKKQVYFKKWMLGAISHGFDRWAMDRGFFWRYFVQDFHSPEWEVNMADNLKKIDGYDDVIPFNWMHTCAISQHGLAEDAGGNLGFQIWGWINGHIQHPGDVVDIHLIGHSRGSVVVTQALQQLSKLMSKSPGIYGGSYIQLTLLDPHPANNKLEGLWGNWAFETNKDGNEIDCLEKLIYDNLNVWVNPSDDESIVQYPNKRPFKQMSDFEILSLNETLYGTKFLTMSNEELSHLGNSNRIINNGTKLIDPDSFMHQSRYFRIAAMDTTIDFQSKAADSKLIIPKGIKKIDIYYQHTPAYMLYKQDDQEFLQNLWGMVSSSTISCEDETVNLEDVENNLTAHKIDGTKGFSEYPGVGVVGHNQVPLVYEDMWVDTGTLNRSPEK